MRAARRILGLVASFTLVAAACVAVTVVGPGVEFAGASAVGEVFVPVTPCRVADTRATTAIAAEATRTFQVAGSGLSPQGGAAAGCGIPDDAVAVELSVTTPAPPGTGFLRVWPADVAMPGAAFLNFMAGRGTTNTGAVRMSSTPGNADLSVAALGSAAHVILDVQGYFVESSPSGSVFVPVTPCRVADTRLSTAVGAGTTRTVQVAGSGLGSQGGVAGGCGVPDGAVAVEVSVTTPAPPGTGFLRAWPADAAPPNATMVNYSAGQGTTNTGAVRLSSAPGTADLTVGAFGATTHVIVDVQGYFVASSPSGTRFVPVTPCRVFDTRSTPSSIADGATRTFQVAGSGLTAQGGAGSGCGVPVAAVAVEVSVTTPAPPGTGFLRAWPTDAAAPNATFVNYSAGQGTTNTGAVRLSSVVGNQDLSVAVFASSSHVIADVQGYFVSESYSPSGPVVNSFTATPGTVVSPALVAFGWSVSDADGDGLTCSIDGNGDGIDDVVVSGCQTPSSRNVAITTTGSLVARLTVSDGASSVQVTTPVSVLAGDSEPYNIEFRFSATTTPQQQAFFNAAADRWESIVVRGVPSAFVSRGAGACSGGFNQAIAQVVDDVIIDVTVEAIDGVGNVLGQAGWCVQSGVDGLPRFGVMRFDSADVATLISEGRFDETVLHELAHVIGFGSLWEPPYSSLLTASSIDPRFTGSRAVAEWNRLGQTGTVPVEATGGAGTARSHWRESTFDTELMTGYLDLGSNPLSRLSIASLADLGYRVDVTQADPYVLPGAFLRLQQLLAGDHDEEHLHTDPITPSGPPAPPA